MRRAAAFRTRLGDAALHGRDLLRHGQAARRKAHASVGIRSVRRGVPAWGGVQAQRGLVHRHEAELVAPSRVVAVRRDAKVLAEVLAGELRGRRSSALLQSALDNNRQLLLLVRAGAAWRLAARRGAFRVHEAGREAEWQFARGARSRRRDLSRRPRLRAANRARLLMPAGPGREPQLAVPAAAA